jgi:hypothetical protein
MLDLQVLGRRVGDRVNEKTPDEETLQLIILIRYLTRITQASEREEIKKRRGPDLGPTPVLVAHSTVIHLLARAHACVQTERDGKRDVAKLGAF